MDEIEEEKEEELTAPRRVSIGGDVILIRIIALVYGMLAFICFLILIVDISNIGFAIVQLIGIGILFTGVCVGIISVWFTTVDFENEKIPSPSSIMIIISVALSMTGIIMGMWGDGRFMDTGEMNWLRLIFVGVVGIFFLAFIEVSHSSKHFTSIAKYAAEHSLTEFSVRPVIINYLMMSSLKFLLITLISVAVLLSDRLLKYIVGIINPQFAESIMLNSVYSLAIMIWLFAYPLVVVLLLLSGRTRAKEIEVMAAEHEAEFAEL
jgi:hypothetical protein